MNQAIARILLRYGAAALPGLGFAFGDRLAADPDAVMVAAWSISGLTVLVTEAWYMAARKWRQWDLL